MRTDEPILTISVAGKLLGLHPRTIMLYEKKGLFSPFRTSTARRMFSIKGLDQLQFIKYLTQEVGINLQGVKTVLEAIALMQKNDINLKASLFPDFKPKALVG